MSGFNLTPHYCKECRQIVIDGTGPKVEQYFEFSYCKVEELSRSCEFFRWTLTLSKIDLYITNKLTLYILQDSEDLEYLNVKWTDIDGKLVSEDTKQTLHIFSMADDPAATYIKSRPIEPSPAKSIRLGWCLEHYKNCLNHETCKTARNENESNAAPTRLLDIRPDSQVRLCTVSQEEGLLYAALSYCWGSSQQQEDAKTTKANFEDRCEGIDIYELPQSIIDAIEVCQRLELSYVWVDALCIVQDNSEDVKSELSKMASIYKGAAITIAAASTDDSTEGFLGNRDLEKAYGNLFRLHYHNKRTVDAEEGSVLLSEHPVADTYQENIDKRAWTMQEDFLSLRLLRFGSKQTTWRCPTYPQAKEIDGGGCPALKNKDYAFSVNNPYRNTEVQSNILSDGPMGGSCARTEWSDTISEYTLRELTKPSDRLSACAALAENFANIMGLDSSDYLAGLWKDDIYAQLLWHRLEKRKARRTFGPSWSWSSIDGPVQFFDRSVLEVDSEVNAAAKYVGSYRDHMPDNHDYSEVGSGRLELNGRLQEAHWDASSLRRSITDADVLPLSVYWDVSDRVSPQTVWCFEIIGSWFSLGLVLVKEKETKEETSYKRVGYFEGIEEDSASVMNSFFGETDHRNIVLH